jgi:hypothetical protein
MNSREAKRVEKGDILLGTDWIGAELRGRRLRVTEVITYCLRPCSNQAPELMFRVEGVHASINQHSKVVSYRDVLV